MTGTPQPAPPQILVVDDEPDLEVMVRQRFRRQIRNRELEFHFSHNGEEALQTLAVQPGIDLVLSDINMPVMDGLTLLGKLNESSEIRKAVIVSAYGDMGNIRTAMNRGAIDFLMKPIDFEDLETTIRKTLDHVLHLRRSLETRERLVAIQRELGVAATIQQSIVPRKFPPFPERSDFELHAHMSPAKEVGGDLFDFFLLDESHLAFVIGDVSGKGVPAALFMAVTRTVLRAAAQRDLPPGECLEYANNTLASLENSSMFVTLFYGILDTRTGQVLYANGGHNPPYVYSPQDGVRMVTNQGGGMLVGIMPDAPYRTASLSLAPGEGIVLYTDGVPEAIGPDEEFFGEDRFERLIAEHGSSSPELLVQAVHAAVREFANGTPPSDDITVLALRYRG
jgi:sigma-B regulation protein RsbU (phosphoserine phosphatase)